ncbi:MAG TPA: ParB/RepB/Spo0J family partition protein [Patescibacteria group bacterium]|nr:ParB/RepB/Spo0J family partition protein [Patescibacteria group bacterium]
MSKKVILGRGLSSLIPMSVSSLHHSAEDQQEGASTTAQSRSKVVQLSDDSVRSDRILHIDVKDIQANPYQPRKDMNAASLNDLAESIKRHGILQPLVVSINPEGGYIMVAGHRRLQAAQSIGLKTVPAVIRETGALEKLELAMIENIQRADLNFIELAEAYAQLSDDFGLTQEEIAKRMGKSRPVIANTLRLLTLPDYIQHSLAVGEINEYQARNLLSVKIEREQTAMWEKMKKGEMTGTRAFEEVQKTKVRTHDRSLRRDSNVVAQEGALEEALGTKVRIKKHGGRGVVIIEFYSDEDLGAIVGRIAK